jgi:hypothetical protein
MKLKFGKIFHSKIEDKMNSIKGELVRSTLSIAETNPDL